MFLSVSKENFTGQSNINGGDMSEMRKSLELEIEEIYCSGSNFGKPKQNLLDCILKKIQIEIQNRKISHEEALYLIKNQKGSSIITKIIESCIKQKCKSSAFGNSVSNTPNWTKTELKQYEDDLNSNPSAYCWMDDKIKRKFSNCVTRKHSETFSYDFLRSIKGRESEEYAAILRDLDGECIRSIPCKTNHKWST